MKTIWVLTYNYGSVKAGPVIRFMRYAPHFASRKVRLVFVTKLREGEQRYMRNEKGIESIHLECNSSVNFTKKALYAALHSKQKPDGLIIFAMRYKNFFHFRNVAKNGIPMIYVSTMQLELDSTGILGSIRNFFLKKILKHLYSTASKIVTSTKQLQSSYKKLGLSSDKIITINNGVDVEKFSPVAEEKKMALRKQLNLPSKEIIFLYVGLFIDRKGVDELVRTFSKLQPKKNKVKLLMVGHEMEHLLENSESFNHDWPKIKQAGLEEGWLICHPFSDAIHEYFQAADVFCFMSKLEGMPNVILEAMASGNALITKKFKGFGEDYGKAGDQFLLLGSNEKENITTFKNLIENLKLRHHLQINAREWAVNSFKITESIKKYVQLFQKKGFVA